MKKILLAIALMLPASCMTPDGRSMANTVNAMAEDHAQMLDAFEAVTTRSEGSPEVKEMILREIRNSRARYYRLSSEVLNALNVATQIDYDQAVTILNRILNKEED
jgi:hypothetical protein